MTYFITDNRCELWLDARGLPSLNLTGETRDANGFRYSIEALAEDATWDNPHPVDVTVQRWMTDGAVAATQGDENREPYFKVIVSATSSVDLAAGEAALMKRSRGPAALTWIPPQGAPDAPATVFEVWTWHLEHEFDDIDEGMLQRMYGLRFTAKPWVRSAAPTTAVALSTAPTPTTTQIDPCTSVTGWAGVPHDPTLTAAPAIQVTGTSAAPLGGGGSILVTRSLTRTGSVTGLGSLPYIVFDVAASGGAFAGWFASADGQAMTQAAVIGSSVYFEVPDGMTSFTTLTVGMTANVTKAMGPTAVSLTLSDVSKTNTVGGIGSRKQLTRTVTIGGSVKTSGSIHIASPNPNPLKNVLLYTGAVENGSVGAYNPPMRQHRTSGNIATVDSTAVSGWREQIVTSGDSAGDITYTVPASALPSGTYAVVGRFFFGEQATMSVTAAATLAANPLGVIPRMTQSITAPVTAASDWIATKPVWGVIGELTLPVQAMPAESDVATVVTLSATADVGSHYVDELYLFDITPGRGALTMLLNYGGSYTHVWIDAPDADPVNNLPAVYIGYQADRSDAIAPYGYVQVISLGDHDFDPDGTSVTSITDGVNDALVSMSGYRRWHTHAGT